MDPNVVNNASNSLFVIIFSCAGRSAVGVAEQAEAGTQLAW